MTFALVTNVGAGGSAHTVTTGSVDTTGSSLLVAVVCGGGNTQPQSSHMTDSKSNIWFPVNILFATYSHSMWYSIPSSVGSSHTFTFAATNQFISIYVLAFSCSNPAPSKWTNASSTSPGSITPTGDNQLFVCGLHDLDASTVPTIGSSFTRTDYKLYSAGNYLGGAAAYKIQTTAAAENPAWNIAQMTNMVTFREAESTAPIAPSRIIQNIGTY